MSETHLQPQAAHALPHRQPTLVYVGGGLGIAGALLGLAIFLAACFGLEASFMFSPLPLLLGIAGILLIIVGTTFQSVVVEDMHVLAGLFINLFAITGGILEMAVWRHWTIFH